MQLELPRRAISGPMLELVAVNFKNKGFFVVFGSSRIFPNLFCLLLPYRRHNNPEHGTLLRHGLDLVPLRDDLEDEPGVLDDNPPDPDAARAAAARDLHLGAVEVGGAELRRGTLAPRVQLLAEHLPDVAQPQPVQRLVDGVLLPRLREVVEPQLAPLPRGEGLGLQGLCALLLRGAGFAAGIAGVEGGGRGGLEEEWSVLDLLGEDSVGAVGAVGSREKLAG